MKKLIRGIVDFRNNVQEDYRKAFGKLATGQRPDALFIACSDSRVVPNTFASTDPGDLFVLRNIGNLIPCCSKASYSEYAGIEFSIEYLNISDIIVCGHSECGAMKGLLDKISGDHGLAGWLENGKKSLRRFQKGESLDNSLSEVNQLSQLNVLQQLENLKTYPEIGKRVETEELHLHAWWFDIAKAEVYCYEKELKRFVIIDETQADKLLSEM